MAAQNRAAEEALTAEKRRSAEREAQLQREFADERRRLDAVCVCIFGIIVCMAMIMTYPLYLILWFGDSTEHFLFISHTIGA